MHLVPTNNILLVSLLRCGSKSGDSRDGWTSIRKRSPSKSKRLAFAELYLREVFGAFGQSNLVETRGREKRQNLSNNFTKERRQKQKTLWRYHQQGEHVKPCCYASQGTGTAKPLSECGQGLPVYAAGKEIQTGEEGLSTSDSFIVAARKVASRLLTTASEKSESDMGDRIESVFNISFWAKEGAIDWSWLGFDSLATEGSKIQVSLEGCEAEEALPATRFGLKTCFGLLSIHGDEMDLATGVTSILSLNPVALVARLAEEGTD